MCWLCKLGSSWRQLSISWGPLGCAVIRSTYCIYDLRFTAVPFTLVMRGLVIIFGSNIESTSTDWRRLRVFSCCLGATGHPICCVQPFYPSSFAKECCHTDCWLPICCLPDESLSWLRTGGLRLLTPRLLASRSLAPDYWLQVVNP